MWWCWLAGGSVHVFLVLCATVGTPETEKGGTMNFSDASTPELIALAVATSSVEDLDLSPEVSGHIVATFTESVRLLRYRSENGDTRAFQFVRHGAL